MAAHLNIWINAAQALAQQLPGIERYDDSNVTIEPDLSGLAPPDSVSLDFQDGVLTASGSAPHAWIASARKQALHIPGITQYDGDGLQDLDLAELLLLKSQLEQTVILFGVDAAQQDNRQNGLGQLPAQMKRLLQIVRTVDKRVRIVIIGHSDSSGRPQRNMELSRRRAEYVRYYLITNGIGVEYLTAQGVGADEPVRDEGLEQNKRMNRSVTFKIHLTDLPAASNGT